MHSSHLISSILHAKWFIDPRFANTQAPVIANLLQQYVQTEQIEPDKLTAFAIAPQMAARAAKYSYWDGFDRAPAGSIAIIKFKGVLLKDDQWCGPIGTARIGEIIKAADAHENIAGIVLHIDSPGGTVDGTEVLGQIVSGVEKPVVTFVDGLMASAAIWVGSFADEIIASTDTDEIGSVGVMLSFADIQPYWESLGVKFHNINASTSPDKNKVWEDLRNDNYDEFIKTVLDPLDEKFMNTIRENLPNVEDKHLSGKIFFARDLMGSIVNSIGTLDDAVNRASELAEEKKNSTGTGLEEAVEEMHADSKTEAEDTDTKKTINSKNMKQFEHVNAALGVESLEAVDDAVSLNEENLEALDTKLGSDNSEELQTELNAANTTIGTQKTTISEHVASIAAKDAEIARLKGKAVEETPAATTEGDDNDLDKGDEKTVVKDDMDFADQVNAVNEEYLANR